MSTTLCSVVLRGPCARPLFKVSDNVRPVSGICYLSTKGGPHTLLWQCDEAGRRRLPAASRLALPAAAKLPCSRSEHPGWPPSVLCHTGDGVSAQAALRELFGAAKLHFIPFQVPSGPAFGPSKQLRGLRVDKRDLLRSNPKNHHKYK